LLVWAALPVTSVARADARASVRVDTRPAAAAPDVPSHFVGFSVEWSLVERYMGDPARPVFANLLRNTGTGVLRIGGISQDIMPFDPGAANTNEVITPEDLALVRGTLELAGGATPSWRAILGTAMAPPDEARPWRGVEHARTFVTQGVAPAFGDEGARRRVAGIELGNEPDDSYSSDVGRYLEDFGAHAQAVLPQGLGLVGPNTSEPIAPWPRIAAREIPTRFFWEWPAILDALEPLLKAQAGELGAFATDHFYPMSRACTTDEYRCASIARLLSEERMDNFQFQVAQHATEAARRGLGYRVEEMNSASNRGVEGVSDVAASAVWALDAMFSAACPAPPDAPAGPDCAPGAIGVNFHNAEVRAFFEPEEGNAFYNAIRYDATPAVGSPSAAPLYYATLLFSSLAQGTSGLRRAPVSPATAAARVKGWLVDAEGGERRLFLVNKGLDRPVRVDVSAPPGPYEVTRLSPHDPSGAGRTHTAPEVRIDGRAVAGDGTWPGFAPATDTAGEDGLEVVLGPAEAAVVSFR
jgi:hypothetical protein